MEKQRRLTLRQKEIIAGIIKGWEGIPTWDQVIEATTARLGFCPSRVALQKQPVIREAWDKKKEKRDGGRQKSKSLIAAEERIEKLREQVRHLEKTNTELVEKFLRWSYNAANAARAPLTEADLNKPIPRIRTSVD